MRLSVCVVTYNQRAYIAQAVGSVLAQDAGFDFEIVIGDDASDDGTSDILRQLHADNPDRLTIVSRAENLGAAENFRQTINACTGEYIAFLEGDDYWTSREKLRLQVAFLDSHTDASFCFHRTRTLDSANPIAESVVPAADPQEFPAEDFLFQSSNPVSLHTVVARRIDLEGRAAWIDDLRLGDWPLCIMLAQKGRIGYIPREMSRYRVHAGGTWSQVSPHVRLIGVLQMFKKVQGLLPASQQELAQANQTGICRWLAGELVLNGTLPVKDFTAELAAIGDCGIATAILADVIAVAREMHSASVWHEQQSRAWHGVALERLKAC